MSSDAIVAAAEPSRRWEWHHYVCFASGLGIILLEAWREGPADYWIVLAAMALIIDPVTGRADAKRNAQRALDRVRRTLGDGEDGGVG